MAKRATSYELVSEYLELSGMCAGRVSSATFPTTTQLTLQFGAGMSKEFLSWVSRSLEGRTAPRGSIVPVGHDGKVVFWDDWRTGQVTQVVFPAVDANSKTSILIGLSVQLERAR